MNFVQIYYFSSSDQEKSLFGRSVFNSATFLKATGQLKRLDVTSAQLRKEIMGSFVLEIEAPTQSIAVGDVITAYYAGQPLLFDVRSTSNNHITAEHISYRLRGRVLCDKYINIPPTFDDRLEFAAIRLQDLIRALNPLYVEAGFELVNQTTSTVEVDIAFSGDNLLSALQKIVEAYNVEYYVTNTQIVFKDRIGTQKGEVKVGYHAKALSCDIDRSELVTRVYPVGGASNLPDGYFYDRLRPTTFNMDTKQHSGILYIEDAEAISKWGLIEKIVEFPHVNVASRAGTVEQTGTGMLTQYNMSFPFIQAAVLRNIKSELALKCTLFIVHNLNAAELQVVHVDPELGRIYYSPFLRDGGTLSWTPAAGDKFVLLGYVDQQEMNEARDKLIEAATKYLAEHARPRIKYRLTNVYKDDLVLDVGDTVIITDPWRLSGMQVNDQARVVSFTYDFITGTYTSVELSNETKVLEDYLWRETLRLRDSLEAMRKSLTTVVRTALPSQVQLETTPPAPANLSAVWGQDAMGIYIELSWSAVENAAGYRVRYSYDNVTFTYLADTLSTTARMRVEAGSTVYLGVATISQNGRLSNWATTSITVGSTISVPAPTISSLYADETILFVSLSYPSTYLKNVAYFEIQASNSTAFAHNVQYVSQTTSASFSVKDLLTTDRQTIYVRARAVSVTSTASSWSSTASIQITAPATEPLPPTNLQLVAGVDHLGAYVEATWQAPNQLVDGYDVAYSYNNAYFTYLPTVGTTTVRFYVMAGATVYVRVASVKGGLRSAWVNGTVTVPTGLVLPAPTNVRAKGIFTTVQVAFDFPADKLAYVHGFEVQVALNPYFTDYVSQIISGTVGQIAVDEYLRGDETTVYVRVRTVSRTGEYSAWSPTVETKISKIKGVYIAAATIDSANIQEGAIKSAHIGDLQVTNAKISDIDASKITTGYLSADRIKAHSLSIDKLEAKMYLTSNTIIAGTDERNFTLRSDGIRRVISRGGLTFDKEIGSILAMTVIRIPPSGVARYKLPEPLLLEDVEIFLQPLSFPISRAGVPATESWSYKVGYKQVGLNEIELYSYISPDVERTTIMNGILVPTGTWASANTGTYTERVGIYLKENFWFGWSDVHFDHVYTTPRTYTVKIMWTGVFGNPSCYIKIDWGDGTMSQRQVGSVMTTGIYAWCYAYNHSTTPTRYYTSGDVILLLIDRRQ